MSKLDDGLSLDAVRAQLGSAYDRFDSLERSRHFDLLRSVYLPEDLAFDVENTGSGHWTVTVCADNVLGALSIIAGIFAAHRIEIVSADAFTLRFTESQTARRPVSRVGGRPRGPLRASRKRSLILDIFEVRVSDDLITDGFWDRFRDGLAGAFTTLAEEGRDRGREEVIDRVSRTISRADGGEVQLYPIAIELSNDDSHEQTRLHIHGTDTPGFLFAFSNALAMLHANIERAEVRTDGGEVHDTFWLTDLQGDKITSESRLHELQVAAALIKHFTYLLPRSPNPAQALRQFHELTRQMLSRQDWTEEVRDLESPAVLETLAELMGVSRFLWEDFLRMQHENLFPVVMDIPALDEQRSGEMLRGACCAEIERAPAHGDSVAALNRFKDREMFRIDLRHITHRIDFRRFSEELSELSEVVVQQAAQLAEAKVTDRFGAPALASGRPCRWTVCALGKFGGRELGFGSDIEMIFVYEAEGATGGPDVIENSRFFREFVVEFTRTISTRSESIFEIDLRLRPYGNAGPLATSLGAFERYYSATGDARQFERMAMVKLRHVAGNSDLGAEIVRLRDEFTYSPEPADLENVTHLRRRQSAELVPTGAVNAKYSKGGLVDLEYFVQIQQIEAGHSDPSVRATNTLDAIDSLDRGGHVPSDHARDVAESYGFIRRFIDALRVVRGNARDLTIPSPDSREFTYLAQRLRFRSSQELEDAIRVHMGFAGSLFDGGRSA